LQSRRGPTEIRGLVQSDSRHGPSRLSSAPRSSPPYEEDYPWGPGTKRSWSRKTRVLRTHAEFREFDNPALPREVQGISDSPQLLASLDSSDPITLRLKNPLVERLAIRSRNPIEFLYRDARRKDDVRDYDTLARLGGIGRARTSQIMDLLNLAPGYPGGDSILLLPRREGPMEEKALRNG